MSKLQAALIDAQVALAGYPLNEAGQTEMTLEVTTKALAGLVDALVGEPGSSGHEIDELFAWVMLDDMDGNEGIPAYPQNGLLYPMVGADGDRMLTLRPMAQQFADIGGGPITLRRFSKMDILETLEPSS